MKKLLELVRSNSMVCKRRINDVLTFTTDIIENNVDGDFVECGTWRGGLAALMLYQIKTLSPERKLHIFDTFEGMVEPGKFDDQKAIDEFKNHKIENSEGSNWCRAGIGTVKETLSLISEDYHLYVKFIQGKVENTLNVESNIPKKIAFLRLDTDWYESTKIELEKLYNNVSSGGVIILDDYGTWSGSKIATDEFLEKISDNFTKIPGPDGSLIIIKEK